MPSVVTVGQQHIIGVDLYHDNIIHGTALFNEAIVDNDKPRGSFRCPYQCLQVNSRITPERFPGIRRRRDGLVKEDTAN